MEEFKVQTINRHRIKTDGHGITSLVGLYGCPLGCRYCLNKDILSNGRYAKMRPEELKEKVMLDYCYFATTGGGVTFGGGEPLLYSRALLEFMDIMPGEVNINLETSLNFEEPEFDSLIEKASELIIDIKAMDNRIYKSYTGRDNFTVIEHLERISALGLTDKCRLRVPVIPNFKGPEEALQDKALLLKMGFENIEIFNYVLLPALQAIRES